MEQLTTDTFFNGRLRVRQERRGYRFSLDAVLVADHCRHLRVRTVLDLGTGCGIIPLVLAYRNPDLQVWGVEIQPELADLAAGNVRENGMKNRVTIRCKDLVSLEPEDVPIPIDLVVSNPPYRRANSGRINPDRQRAVARHEIAATLGDIVGAARRILKPGGRFVTIYPADRTADLIAELRSWSIEPKYLRAIYSSDGSEAKLILVEGSRDGGAGMKIAPPLVIYGESGSYTPEVEAMFLP